MPNRGESELRRSVKRMLGKLQTKQVLGRGLIGDGFGAVEVVGRPGYVNVRVNSDQSQVAQVFSKGWSAAEGTPVIIGETPQEPGIMQVLDIDWGMFLQQGGWGYTGTSYMAKHGWTHRWGNDDLTYVDGSQFMPLSMQETSPPSMQTFVFGGYYPLGANSERWPGAYTADLSYLLPTGTTQYRMVSFYVDPSTGNLKGATGSISNYAFIPWWDFVPAIPDNMVSVAAVELAGNMTAIRAVAHIHDIRSFAGGPGAGATGPTGSVGPPGQSNFGRIVLTGAGGWAQTTGGCAAAALVEMASSKHCFYVLDFDPATVEYAQWSVVMPDNYNSGSIVARFYWTAAAGTGSVVWGIQARSFGDNEALDQAFGSGQVSADGLQTVNYMHVTDPASGCVPAGTPGGREFMQFRVFREATNASDTLSADARLLSVMIDFELA